MLLPYWVILMRIPHSLERCGEHGLATNRTEAGFHGEPMSLVFYLIYSNWSQFSAFPAKRVIFAEDSSRFSEEPIIVDRAQCVKVL